MKFTLSWLKEHLETDASVDEIAETLTDLGLEVEEVVNPADRISAFTLGKVLKAEKHPDAEGLLRRSLKKTRRTIALTYPRDRWFVRVGAAIWNFMLWVFRSDFRSFVHDPDKIEHWIAGEGLEKQFEDRATGWLTQVYVRV